MLSFMLTHKCVAIISWSSDIWHNNRATDDGIEGMKQNKKISKITFNNWNRFDDDEKQMVAPGKWFWDAQ